MLDFASQWTLTFLTLSRNTDNSRKICRSSSSLSWCFTGTWWITLVTKCSYRMGLIHHLQLYLESWSDFFTVCAQAWNQLLRWCQQQFWYHFNANPRGSRREQGVGHLCVYWLLNGTAMRTRYVSFSIWWLSTNTDVIKCVTVIFLWHISKAVRRVNILLL